MNLECLIDQPGDGPPVTVYKVPEQGAWAAGLQCNRRAEALGQNLVVEGRERRRCRDSIHYADPDIAPRPRWVNRKPQNEQIL